MSEHRATQLHSVPEVSNRHGANLGDAVDLLARNFPEPKWLVPDLLPGGLAMLAGKPKSGKSWLALNWAVAIARRAAKGPVLCLMAPPRGRTTISSTPCVLSRTCSL